MISPYSYTDQMFNTGIKLIHQNAKLTFTIFYIVLTLKSHLQQLMKWSRHCPVSTDQIQTAIFFSLFGICTQEATILKSTQYINYPRWNRFVIVWQHLQSFHFFPYNVSKMMGFLCYGCIWKIVHRAQKYLPHNLWPDFQSGIGNRDLEYLQHFVNLRFMFYFFSQISFINA